MLNSPLVFFLFSLFVLWLAEQIGAFIRRRRALKDDEREDFGILQAACLTLLGLIIGFSFSMAISRYDLRKNDEAAEANAIGTEYVRTGLLPAADAAAVRAQLKKYLELRILFYRARNEDELRQINADTTQLQEEMWSAAQVPAVAQPTPVIALAVSGMNDVLNSQGYTQAAWWNRIPMSTWSLMVSSAIGAFLVGVALSGPIAQQSHRLLAPLRDLFAATFFFFFGLEIDPATLPSVALPALALGVVTALTKALTGYWAASRAGVDRRGRLLAGLALVARGEFSIVIAGLGAALEPQLGPLSAAYVLFLAVLGPLLARMAS